MYRKFRIPLSCPGLHLIVGFKIYFMKNMSRWHISSVKSEPTVAAAKGCSWQVTGLHEDDFICHACGTPDADEAVVSFSM